MIPQVEAGNREGKERDRDREGGGKREGWVVYVEKDVASFVSAGPLVGGYVTRWSSW